MKSPFPGLDPYLEASWSDVHQRLITYAPDQLASQLPSELRARVPTNKAGGEGQKLYLRKQHEIPHSDTNLVEIDLVRSGQRAIAFPEHRIPPQVRQEPLVCVRCAWSERARELYVLPLRERLPAIPIPLRQKDRPVLLNLQALLDQCYHNGRYDDIDYSQPPVPPLPAEEAAWAETILKGAGKH